MGYNARMWVRSLAESDGACGGKAVGLARLIAAGLAVPDGFVVDDRAFRSLVGPLDLYAIDAAGHVLETAAARIASEALPADLVREVCERAAELGTLVVRSSSTIEDRPGSSGAGVFASIVRVPAADVWAAIRAVWTSALTPFAASYARQRGELAVGVIVQRFVEGERVTVYTRPPGAPGGDELWVQQGSRIDKESRTAPGAIGTLALRAEAAIDASTGADVELVIGDERWLVQARPITHPVVVSRQPVPAPVIAALVADGRIWTWDVAHNPDPLSPAQAELVARVERANIAPWSLRVCAGYLYTTPAEPAAGESATSTPVEDRDELERRAGEIEARLERALGTDDVLSIEAAIARYLEVYRIWACELVPLIRSARHGLSPELLRGARPSAVEHTLLAAARGELDLANVMSRIGMLAPAWDVAVPTFAEEPQRIRDAIARACTVVSAPLLDHTGDRAIELARAAADLAERDDVWFARAQWLVRRAILARAGELGIDSEDACWIGLDDLAAGLDPDDARRRAAAARSAAERTRSWSMPLTIGGPEATPGPALVGVGGCGTVTGRVIRLASLAATVVVGHGDIIVTRAITPALAVTVIGCAGIVSETGGPLDHGAALARELGIPCIVGCRDAWSLLTDGMLVTLDGDVVLTH